MSSLVVYALFLWLGCKLWRIPEISYRRALLIFLVIGLLRQALLGGI